MPHYFTKLDSTLPDSSVWALDDQTRIVWITMLAMSNRFGEVLASVPGLAGRARVPVAKTQEALEKFMSPDEFSRCEDNEGRRIAKIPGGWLLMGYKRHRDRSNGFNKGKYMKDYMKDYRGASPETCRLLGISVRQCKNQVTEGEKQEARSESTSDGSVPVPSSTSEPSLEGGDEPESAEAPTATEEEFLQLESDQPEPVKLCKNDARDPKFIETVKANPAYRRFDVEVVLGKYVAYKLVRNLKPTQRGFIDWINRERDTSSCGSKTTPNSEDIDHDGFFH